MKHRRNLKIAGVIGFILVVLITVFIVTRAYEFIFPIQKQDDNLEQVQENPLTEEDFLHTEGASIVNQNGETVILTGINLGGWLIQEYWMCPVQGDKDTLQWTNQQTLDTLEERFGREKNPGADGDISGQLDYRVGYPKNSILRRKLYTGSLLVPEFYVGR